MLPVALLDIDAPPRSFDAAVAMVSLHHVVPLGESLRRLSEVMRHGARLVIDEFDVARLDERASAWWLGHAGKDKQPADHVAEMREHLYPVARIRDGAGAVVRPRRAGAVRVPVPLAAAPRRCATRRSG